MLKWPSHAFFVVEISDAILCDNKGYKMNVTSNLTFDLWNYVFQVPLFLAKMSTFAKLGVPEKHTFRGQKLNLR